MDLTAKNLEDGSVLMRSAQKILLVSHRRPDGDTLGATVALHLGLSQVGKQTTLACIDEIPVRLAFITDLLPQTHRFVKEFDINTFDLIIITDAGAYHMSGFHEKYPDFLSKKIPILNIDHHASNEGYGTVNIVDLMASSATIIVWKLFKYMNVAITKEIAFALLTGIYSDTGCFMHSNTNRETFKVASELASTGVQIPEIVRNLFKKSTLSQLKLWGYILENLKKNEKDIVSSVVTESDFKMIGTHSSDTGGIIDLINTVPGALFSMLLAEDEGWVKGSLRTQRNDVNLSDIAGKFGGGGHPKASGFRVHGHLEKQTIWKIVPASIQ